MAVRALLIADRIDTKAIESGPAVTTNPATVVLDGGGVAVVFRFGSVVFFGATAPEQQVFLTSLQPFTHGAYELPDSEEAVVQFEPSSQDAVAADKIVLCDHSAERLQLLAEVLARSVLLGRYESGINAAFDRIEPMAVTLKRTGRTGRSSRALLKHIGEGLLSEHRLVGRVSVIEKPDLLWDNAHLERFYVRLVEEFDINDRYATLQHKQELISRTAQTVLDVLQTQRALRVEIAVLSLIAVEIALTLYDLFVRRGAGS
ncbi:MAG TPA: RMD1 family protein [Planctomycetaceae bacterium]|nr:RMD1 family protein [Planctomycetaceae bacterium]